MNCFGCLPNSKKSKNNMSLLRRSPLLGRYLGVQHTFVDLAASLVKRETKTGQHLFIEQISASGFIYSSGIKDSDRLISLNYTDIEDMPFDDILQAIHSLRPITMGLERSVNEDAIPFVVVLDIGIKIDKTPYLKFSGFYWNVTVQDVERFIPIDFDPLVTYNFSGTDEKVHFSVTENGTKYWLQTDGNTIDFTRSSGTLTSYTVYKYTPTVSPGNTLATILVPTDQPDQCLAATANEVLLLLPFDEVTYTGNNIASHGRFLNFDKQPDDKYFIESTVKDDSRIEKVGMDALMKPDGSLFSWEEMDSTISPACTAYGPQNFGTPDD